MNDPKKLARQSRAVKVPVEVVPVTRRSPGLVKTSGIASVVRRLRGIVAELESKAVAS